MRCRIGMISFIYFLFSQRHLLQKHSNSVTRRTRRETCGSMCKLYSKAWSQTGMVQYSGMHMASGGAGVKRRYGGVFFFWGGGGGGVLPRLGVSRFTILSRFFVMLVFCKLFEQYSQTNFPIIKTKPFKETKYKKVWQIFRPKWVKIKIFVIILSLLLRN